MVYLREPSAERTTVDLGFGGEVPAIQGDSVIVVANPVPGPGADRSLRGTVSYDVQLNPGPRPARLAGQLVVTVRNDVPAAPPSDDHASLAEESRTAVSVYSPFPLSTASIEGHALAVPAREDLGRMVSSAVLGVPPSQSRSVHFDVAGDVYLDARGWYRLDVLRQVASEAEGRVTVSVPPDWRIVEARGLSRTDARHAAGLLPESREGSVWVRIERSSAGGFWDRLVGRD